MGHSLPNFNTLMNIHGSTLVTCKFAAMNKGSFHPDRKFDFQEGGRIGVFIHNAAEIIYIGAYNYIKIIN